MHKDISIAVPTRHRPECMEKFYNSFQETVRDKFFQNPPYLTILLDSPSKRSLIYEPKCLSQVIEMHDKSSLTELWNWGIITAPTDWVLLCNDDIVFKEGWLEYLERAIATGKYLQINLGHYGAFCVHKSLILKIGWHDERYRGGGFEDICHQLKLSEAGLKDKVDTSNDFHTNNPGHDIGKFIDHFKDSSNEGWQGNNNQDFILKKWGRKNPWSWKIPSYRQIEEVDWHPSYTKRYSEKFNVEIDFIKLSIDHVRSKPIFP